METMEKMNWKRWPKENPPTSGKYLAYVTYPGSNGRAMNEIRTLYWDNIDKAWICQGLIITHWTIDFNYPDE